jgi:hypothetical protein
MASVCNRRNGVILFRRPVRIYFGFFQIGEWVRSDPKEYRKY